MTAPTKPPTWLISIDPGLRGTGMAIFEHSRLYTAWYSKNPNKKDRGPQAWCALADRIEREWIARVPKRVCRIDAFVAETPQVYRGRKTRNPADLLEVAGVVGAVAYGVHATKRTRFLPREWKGQVPKETHNRRILAKLHKDEVENIETCPESLRHNVVDAVGIGLFYLGRMGS